MSSDNRYSFIREMRRLRKRRMRIAHYLATSGQHTSHSTDPADASETADVSCEPDEVIRHRLRESGYDPDLRRNHPELLMARMMRLLSILAIAAGVLSTALVIVAATAGTTYAATMGTDGSNLAAPGVDALNPVINKITTALIALMLAVAGFFLALGFFRLLLADGDTTQVERGKRSIKYGCIGLAGALLSPVIVTAIQGLFQQ